MGTKEIRAAIAEIKAAAPSTPSPAPAPAPSPSSPKPALSAKKKRAQAAAAMKSGGGGGGPSRSAKDLVDHALEGVPADSTGGLEALCARMGGIDIVCDRLRAFGAHPVPAGKDMDAIFPLLDAFGIQNKHDVLFQVAPHALSYVASGSAMATESGVVGGVFKTRLSNQDPDHVFLLEKIQHPEIFSTVAQFKHAHTGTLIGLLTLAFDPSKAQFMCASLRETIDT